MKNRTVIVILAVLAIAAVALASMPRTGKKSEEPPARKILYYRNPMDPAITSPVPRKDEMGMDYVPVYAAQTPVAGAETPPPEGEAQPAGHQGVYISPEKQRLVGIATEEVTRRRLVRELRTVGRIAYDPGLYQAQEEYLQALKIKTASAPDAAGDAAAILDAARQKLLLLGMSEGEIAALARKGKSQSNLYLPAGQKSVWAYVSIYEYDMALVKTGMPVRMTATAFPGETFSGRISAIDPVVDPATRTVQARSEINNPGGRLKPGMFLDAVLEIDLGKPLAVPETAVITTGTRNVVFLADPDGYFQSRDVTLGQKAGGYYEVLSGLREGDQVVSSGNFFVDSESRLKSAE